MERRLALPAVVRQGRGLLATALLMLAPPALADDYPFHLESHRSGRGHTITAINEGPAPVSLQVLIHGNNLNKGTENPVQSVVPAYSRQNVADIRADDPYRPYHFEYRHSWIPGDYNAVPQQEYLYRLPFAEGERFLISQADDGPLTTHKADEDHYAVDFNMPEGESVVAARDGLVIAVQDGFNTGGDDPALIDKANTVRVLHSDGSIAHYAHLQLGSIRVSPGQPLLTGQEIGKSGNTGYSTGPHLHFAVSEVYRDENGNFHSRSLPITFGVHAPQQELVPQTGVWALADYSTPAPPTQNAAPSLTGRLATAVGTTEASFHGNDGPSRLPHFLQWMHNVPGLIPVLKDFTSLPWWILLTTLTCTWIFSRVTAYVLLGGLRRQRRGG